MGRHSRLVAAVAIAITVAGAAALAMLATQGQPRDENRVQSAAAGEPHPAFEPDARQMPPLPLHERSSAENLPAAALAAPAAPVMERQRSTADVAPERDTDESSEEFRHSRRGDGQHAE